MARPVAAAAAALFIVDLFLSWKRTAVHFAGARRRDARLHRARDRDR